MKMSMFKLKNHTVTMNVSGSMLITSMVSHIFPSFSGASEQPAKTIKTIAKAHEQLETIEKKGIELEDKEDGFIGPRLPRVMTNEEVKALFRELFPNSNKHKSNWQIYWLTCHIDE